MLRHLSSFNVSAVVRSEEFNQVLTEYLLQWYFMLCGLWLFDK